MNKKKLLKTLSVGFLLFSAGALASCGNAPTSSISSKAAFKVSLNQSELKLIIGDTTKLIATNSEEDISVTYIWESSNESIVKVDDDGNIEAVRAGEATISVSSRGATALCVVTVTSDFYTPSLYFVNDVSSNEQVFKNSSINLATYISFNGKSFYDADVNYILTNQSAGRVENGVFYAGDTIGVSTDVIITASWRNFSSPALRKEITIDVISFKNIYLNNGELSDVELYTVDRIKDSTYKVSQEITSVTAEEDGVAKEVSSVALVSNVSKKNPSSPAVSFAWDNATNTGTVSALAEGSASLKISFIDSIGNEYSKTFTITVNLPIYKIEDMIPYFSINDGKYFDVETSSFVSLASLFPTGEKEVVEATQDGRALTVSGDKVLGVWSDSSSEAGKAELVLYNSVMAVKVTAEAYQQVIDEASDFTSLFSASTANKRIEGYFVVCKDIVTKTNVSMPSGNYPTTFAGTLDGLGHNVSLYLKHASATESWGLFGSSLAGSVKNIAFNNCEMDPAFSGLIANHCESGAAMANVYLNNDVHSTSSTYAFSTFYSTYGYLKINNVVINVPSYRGSNGSHGALGIHKFATGSSDLYIVTPKDNYIGETDRGKSYVYQNEADADTAFSGTKYVIYPTGLWYPTFEDMENAHNDYTSFDSSIWDVTSGIPVFKGLDYYSK